LRSCCTNGTRERSSVKSNKIALISCYSAISQGAKFPERMIDQAFSLQIDQMCPLFVVGQICPNPLRHNHDECSVIHIHPIASTNELVRSVPYEGTIGIHGQVRFVKASHVDILNGVFVAAAAALVHVSVMVFACSLSSIACP
jgi:hypothetical protein